MAKRSKLRKTRLPAAFPQALQPTELKVKNPVGVGRYVSYKGMLGYNEVAFGSKQYNSGAPLEVKPGFATQVPYNSAINSTILQNPSAIPITTLYQAMVSDPIVYSNMLYMVTTIIARIGDYINSNKENEKLIRTTIKRVGKIKLLQSLLTSLWAGFGTAKLIWDYIEGYTTVRSILALPPDSIMLAVVPEGLLDPEFGVMQYYYNINSEWNQNQKAFSSYGNAPFASFTTQMTPQRQVAFNPMFLSALPEDHRIIHVFNPIGLAGNWYGTSLILPIFSNIVDKNNLKFKIQVAATYKAAPMVFAETDTQTQVQINDAGNTISKAEDLQNTLTKGAETGFYISEGLDAVKIKTIDNTANLDEMRNLLDHYNNEIHAGMVTPNLVGNSGSYANAMANNQANDEIINNLTNQLIETIQTQFVEKILDMAVYGSKDDPDSIPVSEREYGYFELLDNSLNDKALWAKILESAKSLNIVDPTSLDDVNSMRKKLGLSSIDKLTDDLIYGQAALWTEGESDSKSNIAKAKEEANIPYANGLNKVQNDHYGQGART